MDPKKPLSDKELEEIVANLGSSDDEFDSSGDEFSDYENFEANNVDIESLPLEFEDGVIITNETASEDHLLENDATELEETVEAFMEPVIPSTKNIRWKKKNLVLDDAAKEFRGNSSK